MKRSLSTLVAAAVWLSLSTAQAALLVYEPFSTNTFPHASTNLGRPVAGWTLGAVPAEGSSVVRSAAGLNYAGLATEAGSKGVARVPNTGALERNVGRLLSSTVSAGAVYCSFLLKVTTLPDVNRALLVLSYFGSGNIDARDNGCNGIVWLAPDGRLLIGKYNAATPTAGPTWPLVTNATYLVVLKYALTAGANNDLVALYLNPPLGQNETEPATPVIATAVGSDAPGDVIKSVWLPQGTIEGAIDYHFGSFSGEINMDELRVGTSWAEVTPWDGVTPPAGGTPLFTGVLQEGGSLELRGVAGPPHGAFRMLHSTSLTTPGDTWPVLGVSNFDDQGKFSFTDLLSPTNPVGYYRVLLGSGGPAATVPPAIASQPQDLTLPIGADAVFSVSAVGSVPLAYQWYYNTNTVITNATKPTLTIPNAQFSAAGKYSVRISNFQGSITSVLATLTVTNLTTGPELTLQPASVTATEGQTAIFNAAAVGMVPLNYQWYFNTNTLLAGQTNSTLTLTNVQPGQAGKYSMTVANQVGDTNSGFVTLTVNPSGGSPNFDLVGWATMAGGVTGGAGAGTGIVTTASEFLAAVESPGPSNILVSGTITLPDYAMVQANKTILGMGTNAAILGAINLNSRAVSVTNIIIRNLHLSNPNGVGDGDAVVIQYGAHHIWIDHCTLSDAPDGLLDIVEASDYITVSWCKFVYTWTKGHRFTSLFSKSDASVDDRGKLKITYHHNWWSTLCTERMPRGRFGKIHCFNNYYYSPGNNYCIRAGVEAQILVENNYFRDVNAPYGPWPGTDGKISAAGNLFDNTAGTIAPGTDFIFTPPYGYALDSAANIPSLITNWAGAGKVNF
jgi:pectate lyase